MPSLYKIPVPTPSYSTRIGGRLGERIDANLHNWQLPALVANPGMIEMFRDRDSQTRRDLLPWSGEFVGKFLTCGVIHYRLTRDPDLHALNETLVAELCSVQSPEGYLGPHPESQRMTGKIIDGRHDLWDVWGHYHCLLGLMHWSEVSGSTAAWQCARKTADYIVDYFMGSGRPVSTAGECDKNQAIAHTFSLLYSYTGETRYLEMAKFVVKDFEAPVAGDYYRAALEGKKFFEMNKPRWESLHPIQALAELHFIDGDPTYREAFEKIWWSIAEYDRHNTGGFTSGEKATGNPYDLAPIETCCTVAWTVLSVDMLRLTRASIVADELELSTLNGVAGAQSPSGRWWTYDSPMIGYKKASTHDIAFQARPGTPELNCCSVNGPRALGLVADWAVLSAEDGIRVNYYGTSETTATTPSGEPLKLRQETEYPLDPAVTIHVAPASPQEMTLMFRIPAWSKKTRVFVNGEPIRGVRPGDYCAITREWRRGDVVQLEFDFSLHYWVGERECAGKVSVYRGPILLTYDQAYNDAIVEELDKIDPKSFALSPVSAEGFFKPWLLLEGKTVDGNPIRLCDYASAGWGGYPFTTWIPSVDVEAVPFSQTNPLRSTRF